MKQIGGKKFCRILENQGWTLQRIKGSHHIFGKPGQENKISVPVHGNKPLKSGLLNYFMKVAGLEEKNL
ncbi:MAG: type II toxin-antitoxin system HicA family toxin [Candidatus Aminicenantes bacterium]|nr:type II toxin-antitoxin system HicA family toxin [Candidatus Aminicenantes bacterium]